ncbi:unnamed protein product [Lactuca saligna]|uniref:Uncharacterized protein n=1 Tax=Lactuca saligna TaxID=75948 RepID=A0AA35ZBI6_LACSI|nr:unnamed protein product [Lactuca saligna]
MVHEVLDRPNHDEIIGCIVFSCKEGKKGQDCIYKQREIRGVQKSAGGRRRTCQSEDDNKGRKQRE